MDRYYLTDRAKYDFIFAGCDRLFGSARHCLEDDLGLEIRSDAEAWLVETRHDIARGIHTPGSISPTVKEAAALWIKRCHDKALEPMTVKGYDGKDAIIEAGGGRLSSRTRRSSGIPEGMHRIDGALKRTERSSAE